MMVLPTLRCAGLLLGALLPLLDQLADLVPALPADLLVEGRAPLRLDGLSALLADLLVALPAASLADTHAALPARLGDRHRPLAAALLVLSHGSPPFVHTQCARCP